MLEFHSSSIQELSVISLRLVNAVVVGAVIGWEREVKDKLAGLRTHMLVALGAAIFVLVPIFTGDISKSPDALSRTIQGIATGVSFLGAGEILHISQSQTKYRIRGLTSAAAIWISAASGLAAGCGLWHLSLIGALLNLIILRILKIFERYSRRE
ncbi:MgtC/SapB family protein [Pleurocapsales cyanobacterium LEGE 10410]|nr:MgtC/SapB family protein [Pleurocapsales cyanobacterium LEGE 10410]